MKKIFFLGLAIISFIGVVKSKTDNSQVISATVDEQEQSGLRLLSNWECYNTPYDCLPTVVITKETGQ